jgi:PAB-dependent poly(A)-specific ribonuclease subunit 2
MSGSYATIAPISSSLNGFAQPITALSFDPVSDILWAGLESGIVAAYLGRQGVRGPSFRVGGRLSVKKIIAGDYVHAADNGNEVLGSWTKGGVNKWHFRSVDFISFISCKLIERLKGLLPSSLHFQTHRRLRQYWRPR